MHWVYAHWCFYCFIFPGFPKDLTHYYSIIDIVYQNRLAKHYLLTSQQKYIIEESRPATNLLSKPSLSHRQHVGTIRRWRDEGRRSKTPKTWQRPKDTYGMATQRQLYEVSLIAHATRICLFYVCIYVYI